MATKIIVGPSSEPITLAEAKAHARVFISDDDAYITALIVAARQSAEQITGRALMPQTLELAMDAFHETIRLAHSPVVAISSVKYVDASGTTQTMDSADYVLDTHSTPARLVSAYGVCWPSARSQENAVLVRYTAGYENAAAVPQAIKQWMLLRIGMLYEHRATVVAGVALAELPYVDRLLDPYVTWSV